MTIDDFDLNEMSDRLAIREENESTHTLQADHDDAHGDGSGCSHDDVTDPCSHDDACIPYHDDGHDDHDDAPILLLD